MTTSGITNINAKLIHQHPDNPRKDLGDLSELSESIKKKGIMQNLTVIPGYWDENRAHHDEGYTLIIGHRRFAAGKMAGVTMYPCRIVPGHELQRPGRNHAGREYAAHRSDGPGTGGRLPDDA